MRMVEVIREGSIVPEVLMMLVQDMGPIETLGMPAVVRPASVQKSVRLSRISGLTQGDLWQSVGSGMRGMR